MYVHVYIHAYTYICIYDLSVRPSFLFTAPAKTLWRDDARHGWRDPYINRCICIQHTRIRTHSYTHIYLLIYIEKTASQIDR